MEMEKRHYKRIIEYIIPMTKYYSRVYVVIDNANSKLNKIALIKRLIRKSDLTSSPNKKLNIDF